MDVVRQALSNQNMLIMGISNPFRIPYKLEEPMSEAALEHLRIARLASSNPWPYWLRVFMIREGIRSEGENILRVITMPNMRYSGIPTEETRPPKSMTTVYVCPKDHHNLHALHVYKDNGWNVVEVTQDREHIGAGMIRKMILKGYDWQQYVPSGTAEVLSRYLEGEPYSALLKRLNGSDRTIKTESNI